MAKFEMELPLETMKILNNVHDNTFEIFGEMCLEAGKECYAKVKSNMRKSFKTTGILDKGLTLTRVYRTPSDDGINVKVGFYGYDTRNMNFRGGKGTPIPLIAMAREYGTSMGEAKKPFFRKSFNKKQIEKTMKRVQDKWIPSD